MATKLVQDVVSGETIVEYDGRKRKTKVQHVGNGCRQSTVHIKHTGGLQCWDREYPVEVE